jgi:Ca2+-binding EF-hand superfamily protein
MKTALLGALALAVGLLGTAAANAHSGGQHSSADRFKAMDADGDGQVTRAEAQASAKARFAGLDKNSDGKITADERKGAGRRGGHKGSTRTDKDGDGSLNESEFVVRALAHFDRMDQNGDAVVTADELEKAKAKRRHH